MSTSKDVNYYTKNTYQVLNEKIDKAKNTWLVFHGIGYLSKYFLKYFKHLDPEENYVIVPQAPSKYYLNGQYKHVGASWLTREDLEMEIENNLNYLDAIFEAEDMKNCKNLNILGYSQGVSMATRFVARRKIICKNLIMHSGKVPNELDAEDFKFLEQTNFSFIYGSQDEYLNQEILKVEEKRLKEIFPRRLEIISFDGGHEVNTDIISKFA